MASFKKKKNVIFVAVFVILSFILYQLYFFLTITSEVLNKQQIVHVLDHSESRNVLHLKSKEDEFINQNGVIRGVFYGSLAAYRPTPNNEYKCFKSQEVIPFDAINDDFCDCEDGTDEPSTSACVKGIFYCDNQYVRKPKWLNTVPSSKVNDGICDCCDGSDEWLHEPGTKILTQANSNHYRYYADKCPNVCYK